MIRFEDIYENVKRHHAGADLEVLRKAYIFSAVEHKGQTRASGEPYLVQVAGKYFTAVGVEAQDLVHSDHRLRLQRRGSFAHRVHDPLPEVAGDGQCAGEQQRQHVLQRVGQVIDRPLPVLGRLPYAAR